jgi:hypothetical protein
MDPAKAAKDNRKKALDYAKKTGPDDIKHHAEKHTMENLPAAGKMVKAKILEEAKADHDAIVNAETDDTIIYVRCLAYAEKLEKLTQATKDQYETWKKEEDLLDAVRAYLKMRRNDVKLMSDWEVSRWLYAEVLSTETRYDLGTTYKLINESKALSKLLKDPRAQGMSLLNTDSDTILKREEEDLMPYIPVRGKAGGQNHVLDLVTTRNYNLQDKNDANSRASKYLHFGIFDARHQPHPDFWEQMLPKFFQLEDNEQRKGYVLNKEIAFVQAPQSFAKLNQETDFLDVSNGLCFNMMNVIRNSCGGVTSCGTNAVWQVDMVEHRKHRTTWTNGDVYNWEFFDSRTKIEDTASSHKNILMNKRSVYVHTPVATGVAKLNADYLGAVQRWAEGAVQLFWVHVWADSFRFNFNIVFLRLVIALLVCFIAFLFYFSGMFPVGDWPHDFTGGKNLICAKPGDPTYVDRRFTAIPFGYLCEKYYEHLVSETFQKTSTARRAQALDSYMRIADNAFVWFCVVSVVTVILNIFAGNVFCCCGMRRTSRRRFAFWVRLLVVTENITYFWTTVSTFFWFILDLWMVLGNALPFNYEINEFMKLVLFMKISETAMVQTYKNRGGCTELSIWRSQQSFTIMAPLHIMSIFQGTAAALSIWWNREDKSFWNATDLGDVVTQLVKVWVTVIWVCTLGVILFLFGLAFNAAVFGTVVAPGGGQLCACFLMVMMAITVLEPTLVVYDAAGAVDRKAMKEKKVKKEDGSFVEVQRSLFERMFFGFLLKWREHAWIIRYILDFGLPVFVLTGLAQNVALLGGAAYSTTLSTSQGRT